MIQQILNIKNNLWKKNMQIVSVGIVYEKTLTDYNDSKIFKTSVLYIYQFCY